MKNSLVIFFSLAMLAVFSGCQKKQSQQNADAPVIVAKAVFTNVPVQIQPQPVGHIVAFASVAIHSQIGGVLQQVHFTEGAEVKSNDLMVTIDPRPMQAALTRDRAQLENAQAQFIRDQTLVQEKIESQNQLDVSKASRDALAATVQSDELNLSFTEIRAPFDGIASAMQKHPGDVVKAPDDILLTINRIHPIYAQFPVPERFLPEIKKQMTAHTVKVSAWFEGMSGEPPQGELTFVDNSVDPMTGTIQLRAAFPNEDDALWPGQFVRLTMTLSEISNAIVVPSQAVQTGQRGQFIYVIKPDETAEERPVEVGISYNGMTVVESGLKNGETVVTDGQLRLAPGVKVSVKTEAAASTNSAAIAP